MPRVLDDILHFLLLDGYLQELPGCVGYRFEKSYERGSHILENGFVSTPIQIQERSLAKPTGPENPTNQLESEALERICYVVRVPSMKALPVDGRRAARSAHAGLQEVPTVAATFVGAMGVVERMTAVPTVGRAASDIELWYRLMLPPARVVRGTGARRRDRRQLVELGARTQRHERRPGQLSRPLGGCEPSPTS